MPWNNCSAHLELRILHIPLYIFTYSFTSFENKKIITSLLNRLWIWFLPVMTSVLFVGFRRVIGFPATRWKDVFVSFIPWSEYHFSGMTLLFLHAGVIYHSNVLAYVKTEEWTTFTPRFGDDKVIKVLVCGSIKSSLTYINWSALTDRSSRKSDRRSSKAFWRNW